MSDIEEQIRQMNKAGRIFKEAMFSLSKAVLKAADAVRKLSGAMNNIKMDKRLRRMPQISCKYKGRQIRL